MYTYDDAGNILSKKVYAFTTSSTLGTVQQTFSYTYGNTSWKDLLTNWNGTAITYDAIGNPTQIGTSMLTWQGRQLMSYVGNGKTLSFTYNADGIRTTKTVDGVAHEYILSGSQVIAEKWGNHTVAYFYDENGTPIGLCYRNNADAWGVASYYFFDKNLQGDIVAIYNESGVKIGSYTYDAWGNFTVAQTAGISELDALVLNTYNPFRYRGYFYDVETGLYYLQSRYYNPQWGRFINADACLYNNILGFNLFLYCYNNPMNYVDYTGESAVAMFTAWASSAWTWAAADGPLPFGDIVYVVGAVALGVVAIAELVQTIDLSDDKPSLPNESEVDVDIDHIMQEHHPNGGKGPKKDKFPKWMTAAMVEETVRNAYQSAVNNLPQSIIKIQENVRYYLQGFVGDQKINIWFDFITKTITTAFPK